MAVPKGNGTGTGWSRGFGVTATRKKWDVNEILSAPTSFLDDWLAENPASEEERDVMSGFDKVASRGAAVIPIGFEKEALEIREALACCNGDLERFEREYANHDFFADCEQTEIRFFRKPQGNRLDVSAESVDHFPLKKE